MSAEIIEGDCIVVMAAMAPGSVDAIVTDPPYHLTTGKKGGSGMASVCLNTPAGRARIGTGFMGKAWDGGDIAQSVELWREAYRVLKPGGHLVAFGGTRTSHRMICAIEDAGFEIRDSVMWVYGSGFPKSHNIGNGLGTALKPAHEPICVARKPLIGTVAANVQQHGTGAINIDGCRVDGGETITTHSRGATTSYPKRPGEKTAEESGRVTPQNRVVTSPRLGRWPANLIHDGSEEVLDAFAQFGERNGGHHPTARGKGNISTSGHAGQDGLIERHSDTGSAARFYYCAKASKADRDEGLTAFAEQQHVQFQTANGTSGKPSSISEGRDTRYRNTHPTVKPTALMRYLCRLVTPPGGLVLDPFAGSGSTGKAAAAEGFSFIGIEREPGYVAIARARLQHAMERAP